MSAFLSLMKACYIISFLNKPLDSHFPQLWPHSFFLSCTIRKHIQSLISLLYLIFKPPQKGFYLRQSIRTAPVAEALRMLRPVATPQPFSSTWTGAFSVFKKPPHLFLCGHYTLPGSIPTSLATLQSLSAGSSQPPPSRAEGSTALGSLGLQAFRLHPLLGDFIQPQSLNSLYTWWPQLVYP